MSDEPQIGMIIVKPGSEAVTVAVDAVWVVLSVGVRPPAYRNGAISCFVEVDSGSDGQLVGGWLWTMLA